MFAAKIGCLPVVKLLVEYSANTELQSKIHKWDAMKFALLQHRYEVVEYLQALQKEKATSVK